MILFNPALRDTLDALTSRKQNEMKMKMIAELDPLKRGR